MTTYNDFITINRTTCYFILDEVFQVASGVIVGYNNFNGTIKIRYKQEGNSYIILYRSRDRIWFTYNDCLLWLNEWLREHIMPKIYIMDLSSQLDGVKNVINLTEAITDSYTIYLNGLRQNRENYVIDNENLTLTIYIDPLPESTDVLTIEYWKRDESVVN